MSLHTSEASAKAGPGIHCGGYLLHSARALRLQTLTRRGLSPAMAEVLAPFVWGGPMNG
jgi:hypothetical protein